MLYKFCCCPHFFKPEDGDQSGPYLAQFLIFGGEDEGFDRQQLFDIPEKYLNLPSCLWRSPMVWSAQAKGLVISSTLIPNSHSSELSRMLCFRPRIGRFDFYVFEQILSGIGGQLPFFDGAESQVVLVSDRKEYPAAV